MALGGCAYIPSLRYGPDKQTREDFEKRVEAAFKLQNHMTSEMMVLQDMGQEPKQQDALLRAEQNMQRACRYLNDYASKEMDKLDTSLLLLSKVEDSVADCESAARQLEALLK